MPSEVGVRGGPFLAPYWHLLLLLQSSLPLFLEVPTSWNVICTAVLTLFVGCWRSVKPQPPEDTMSKKDALKFPLIGSAVLFSLFLAFKIFPKEFVNMILTVYCVVLGALALTACIAPFIAKFFPENLREEEWKASLNVPFVKEPIEFSATYPEIAVSPLSIVFCGWYLLNKHWYANNILGIAFSIQGIEHLSVGSVQVGSILLSGLFIYDIFWVFCTPVMVAVAKSFDGPIKLLFPRPKSATDLKAPFSMLGLGDIVIPGIFVALILRYDDFNGMQSKYFYSAFGGYIGGLGLTILVMNVFNAAQPALLYIVPCVLGSLFLHAFINGEFIKVFNFKEDPSSPKKSKSQ